MEGAKTGSIAHVKAENGPLDAVGQRLEDDRIASARMKTSAYALCLALRSGTISYSRIRESILMLLLLCFRTSCSFAVNAYSLD
jgi:hypothetical protein